MWIRMINLDIDIKAKHGDSPLERDISQAKPIFVASVGVGYFSKHTHLFPQRT